MHARYAPNQQCAGSCIYTQNTMDERRGTAAIRTVYAYNRRNEMTKVTLPNETLTTMTYDGDGLRRTKQTASGTTTYVWDGSDYLGEIS